jgi:alpha-glucosidase (family GH31 glycosyl hydrolase)
LHTHTHTHTHTHARQRLRRSTFPGAGKWTAHWTGDNGANWENLFWSITGIMNTNMWGMAMVGSDICGFLDELVNHPGAQLPPEELEHLCMRCGWGFLVRASHGTAQGVHQPAHERAHTHRPGTAPPHTHARAHTHRWASVGAFYPFSRNHYSYNSRPHEYYRCACVCV